MPGALLWTQLRLPGPGCEKSAIARVQVWTQLRLPGSIFEIARCGHDQVFVSGISNLGLPGPVVDSVEIARAQLWTPSEIARARLWIARARGLLALGRS